MESLFNKVKGLKAKRDSSTGAFTMNFVKFLRTPFLQNISGGLPLDCLEQKKNPDTIFQISHNAFNKHVPIKKKHICGNNKSFITRAYTIIKKHNAKNTPQKYFFNKETTILRMDRKEYFGKLNEKAITDNKKFRDTVKHFFG